MQMYKSNIYYLFHANKTLGIYYHGMCFNQRGDISTLKGGPLKLVDK